MATHLDRYLHKLAQRGMPGPMGDCEVGGVVKTRTSVTAHLKPISRTSMAGGCSARVPTGATASDAGARLATDGPSGGSGTISTVAGGGIGDGGPGLDAELFLPKYEIFDEDNNLYVSVQGRVVMIDPAGVPTTYAGTGTSSGMSPSPHYYGDGRPASQANFGNGGPAGLAFGPDGSLYIADIGNRVIRKVALDGTVSTVAGGAQPGHYGIEGDDPLKVNLWAPDGIDVDDEGNLFIADSGHCTVREIRASDGKIYTVAGIPPGPSPQRLATCTYTEDGVPALGSGLYDPRDVKVDAAGNLYIADQGNNRIRKIDTNGIIHTVAGNGDEIDSGDGGQATQAGVVNPWHIALGKDGAIYIAEYFGQKIRKVSAGGVINTFAGTGAEGFSGDGGPATQANLEYPLGVAEHPSGDSVFIADFGNNRIRKVDAAGNIQTFAGNGLPPREPGGVYHGNGFSGDGLAARSATLSNAVGVVVDDAGDLFIADTGNNRIRKVDAATGVVDTVVGTGEAGSSGDGGPATSATIKSPVAVAVDDGGRLYLGQLTGIRVVDETGTITRFAGNGAMEASGDGGPAIDAGMSGIAGLAFDADGNLYVSDSGNSRIRRIDTQGIITTVAGTGTRGFGGDGGPATAAKLNIPWGLAFDPAGNLYFADGGNNRIRKVDTNGTISTVAGNGASGYDGDGGAATATALNFPTGVAVDAAGNVFTSEWGNCLLRRVDAQTGDIHTVAGIPPSFKTATPSFINCDFTGDGGPGVDAYIFAPAGLSLGSDGSLYFADAVNSRIRALEVGTSPSPEPTTSPSPTPSSSPSPTPTGSDGGGAGAYPMEPSDPLFPEQDIFFGGQWALRNIQAPSAWQQAHATGSGVVVADLDSGLDLDHPDFDCPGKVDLLAGSDFIQPANGSEDRNGHGTHTAGIIGACTDNGIGVAGTAPDVTIMPVRVLDATGSGNAAVLAQGIRFAADNGADVINMSIGFRPGLGFVDKHLIALFDDVNEAVNYAQSKGVVVIASAGNESFPICDYPAFAEDVVCVGATDTRDLKSWYGNFPVKGDDDDTIGPALVAPGGSGQEFCDVHSENVVSTWPVNLDDCKEVPNYPGYLGIDGTSMAAPHVSGVAALVYERLGGGRSVANARTVIDAIIDSAEDLGPPGYDPIYGFGRLDALAAVCAVGLPCTASSPTPSPSGTGAPSPTSTQMPTPTPTGSTPPASQSPAPGSTSPAPSATAKPSATATRSPDPTPSGSQSSSASAPPRGSAGTTIASSKEETEYNESFVLWGRVTGDAACTGPIEVDILKRVHGTTAFDSVGTAEVEADGSWRFKTMSRTNASYAARPLDSSVCAGQTSSPTSVLVRADIDLEVPSLCDAPQRIRGVVHPNHSGTDVILQRKRKKGWSTLDADRLDRHSRFALLSDVCMGRFRVLWPSQNEINARGARTFRL
jgi:subtilisin family serine protease/sugar lactone lactonase YvrE